MSSSSPPDRSGAAVAAEKRWLGTLTHISLRCSAGAYAVLLAQLAGCDDSETGPQPPLVIPDIVVILDEAGPATDSGIGDAARDASSLEAAAIDAPALVSSTGLDSGRSNNGRSNDSRTVDTEANPLCGNGLLELGEQCDDGNQNVADGCVQCFTVPFCGNRRVEAGEHCDDGNTITTDGCAGCVVVPLCGNGSIEFGEECDSPDASKCQSCKKVKTPTCGNGRVEFGEQCDSDAEACVQCRLVTPLCGDGVVNSDEQCDDANTFDNDGCDRLCRVRKCGDGIVQEGEHCDPPGTVCRADCTLLPPHCGDGTTQVAERETCDDGNDERGDGCYNCDTECGNGIVEPILGELCEPEMVARPCTASITSFCVPCASSDCETRDMCNAESCQPVLSCTLPPQSRDAGAEGHEGELVCESTQTPGEPCHLPPTNLTPTGGFELDSAGFAPGDPRVALSHVDTDGFAAQGALLVLFDNQATGGSNEARGAALCLSVEPNKVYDFQAAYRFLDATWQSSGVTVSLFLYNTADCTGSPVTPEQSRGVKAGVETSWTGYSSSADTSSLNQAGPTSMLVKLDVWRSPELSAVSVLWDDVSVVERGAITPCDVPPGVDAGASSSHTATAP